MLCNHHVSCFCAVNSYQHRFTDVSKTCCFLGSDEFVLSSHSISHTPQNSVFTFSSAAEYFSPDNIHKVVEVEVQYLVVLDCMFQALPLHGGT